MHILSKLGLAFLLLTTTSCFLDGSKDEPNTQGQPDPFNEATAKEVIANYTAMVYANYTDAYNKAVEMQTAIIALINTPSEQTLNAAKTAWLAAREPYGLSEVYRFQDGPIDFEDAVIGGRDGGPEGQLNAWPLDEAYIDYVYDYQSHQLVNNGVISGTETITKELLISLNEAGKDDNISTGYHAIEFLLWGQDYNSDGYTDSSGNAVSGTRPFTDYTTEANAERRKTYLTVVTALLIEDLAFLVSEWTPSQENYRKTFEALDAKEAIKILISSMGEMSSSELSSERMQAALTNHDQEEEHSCFSDNTHRDIYLNAKGIANVFMGDYGSIQGKGLSDLLEGNTKTKLEAQLDASLTAIETMPVPFDYAISSTNSDGNAKVEAAIAALKLQGATMLEFAAELGIEGL